MTIPKFPSKHIPPLGRPSTSELRTIAAELAALSRPRRRVLLSMAGGWVTLHIPTRFVVWVLAVILILVLALLTSPGFAAQIALAFVQLIPLILHAPLRGVNATLLTRGAIMEECLSKGTRKRSRLEEVTSISGRKRQAELKKRDFNVAVHQVYFDGL